MKRWVLRLRHQDAGNIVHLEDLGADALALTGGSAEALVDADPHPIDPIGVEIEAGAEMIATLAATLSSDPGFVESVRALDFTRFNIDLDGETCSATVEVMGASLVSIAFPPIRSYVRLHDDQREALLAGLTSLFRLTAG